jgi:ABC-2 type transport system permease protein
MRWLLLKDLQILRRSPLLVALLVIYPIVIAVLIGFALSRGPDKPRVAFLNLVPPAENTISLGSQRIDVSRYANELFKSIEPVRVKSRREAVAKVRSGEVLAALVIPADITRKLETGLQSADVQVIYNGDALKQSFVESTIESKLGEANAALSDELKNIAKQDVDLLLNGGRFSLFGRDLDILGLKRSKTILDAELARLPPGRRARSPLAQVASFAGIAVSNLDLSKDILGTVSRPVKVGRVVIGGKRTPLDTFAVAVAVTISLMFVTVLLAAGMLALEREEHAFSRLVRGLVSRAALLAEKVSLAAGCAFLVTLVMLAGLGIFVTLDWSRFPLWLAAIAGGALAFAAMGVAIGGLAREVRAASLLAFLLSLPIAFLALVPSGAVSHGLYDVIRVVSALFPFKASLQAVSAALNDTSPGVGEALVHLLALALGFGVVARLALRRFA